MIKNKKLFFGILVLFGLVLIFQVFVFFKKNKQSSSVDSEQPVPTVTVKIEKELAISGKVFRMPKKEGGFLELKNPLENNKYLLGDNAALIEEATEYNIEFQNNAEGALFYLSIKDRDIQRARDLAEKALLDYLEISKEQACQINVVVGVIPSVNERAAGSDYGLSFCPDGKPFPSDWRKYQ